MSHVPNRLQRVALLLAGIIAFASLCVIAGWHFRIPILKGSSFGTFVAPNTALCFLLCSAAIFLLVSPRGRTRFLGTALGALVLAFALATLSEYLFDWDFGIDRLFMGYRLSDWTLPRPGRFALNSTIGFTFAGISLVMIRIRPLLKEVAASCILFISYLSIIGYIYSAPTLYNAGAVMSLHTGFFFLLLSIALLCAGDRPILLNIALSPYAGGVLSRRILPLVFLLLPAAGWLTLAAYRKSYLSVEITIAVLVLTAIAAFAFATFNTARVLNRTDRRQRDAEVALLRNEKIGTAGRMAASVAHEINNPLEAVGNILYLLRSSDIPEQTRLQYLSLADDEIRRVAAIARRTLGFYRDDSSPSLSSPAEIVESVLEIYRGKLAAKNVVIERSFDEQARVFLRPGELRQIIANLISNAIDAMPDSAPRLQVSVMNHSAHIFINVADNGHGIPPEHLSRIFEPFFTTKKTVGTGLGLWMSRELAIKNGGTIEIAPAVQGATFRLTFPAAKADAVSRSA